LSGAAIDLASPAGHDLATVVDRTDFLRRRFDTMPRGDKSKYTDKQKRQAEHIEEGYEKRGLPEREAARRAWATVNKETGGGKKEGGSGRGKRLNTAPSRKGGRISQRKRTFAQRSSAARKAAATRQRLAR
jgi:plasmid stabilization system protein ParE